MKNSQNTNSGKNSGMDQSLLPTKKATTNPGTGIRSTGSTAPTHINAEFTENELQDLGDYYFTNDETIYTGDFLDDY